MVAEKYHRQLTKIESRLDDASDEALRIELAMANMVLAGETELVKHMATLRDMAMSKVDVLRSQYERIQSILITVEAC